MGFTVAAPSDLARLVPRPEGMSDAEAMALALAEKLGGTIRAHTGHAVSAEEAQAPASGRNRSLVAHLKGVQADPPARSVAAGQGISPGAGGLRGAGGCSARRALHRQGRSA